jgi:hypothetical protein
MVIGGNFVRHIIKKTMNISQYVQIPSMGIYGDRLKESL